MATLAPNGLAAPKSDQGKVTMGKVTMAQLIEALRSTVAKWRAGKQEHREGVVLVWEGEVYGWKNELRDPASERPGAYAMDKTGLVFKA